MRGQKRHVPLSFEAHSRPLRSVCRVHYFHVLWLASRSSTSPRPRHHPSLPTATKPYIMHTRIAYQVRTQPETPQHKIPVDTNIPIQCRHQTSPTALHCLDYLAGLSSSGPAVRRLSMKVDSHHQTFHTWRPRSYCGDRYMHIPNAAPTFRCYIDVG